MAKISSAKDGFFWTSVLCFLLLLILMCDSMRIVSSGPQKEKIMACYFAGGKYGNLSIDKADPFICTHIICANGVIQPDGIGGLLPGDLDMYKNVADLKDRNPDLKVMVSLSHGYDSIMKTPTVDVFERFSMSAISFLERMNLDGIDLDWEFPSILDKERFILFIKTLGTYLHSSNLLLSAALPSSPFKLENGFDIDTLNEYMDFMTVMTYGYHGYIKNVDDLTAYNSPLYTLSGEPMFKSTADTITYFLYKGLSKEKILMGIPTYGKSYTLANATDHGLHCLASGQGGLSPYSRGIGLVIYADICVAQKQGASIVQDEVNVGEYFYHGSYWASFEGKFSLLKKMEWLEQRELAGVGIWAYQYDDFANVCGNGSMPLLTLMQTLLRNMTKV